MESSTGNRHENHQIKRLLLGVIVIIAGLILLGFNAGIVTYQFKHVVFSWQMLLIIIGVISLLVSENRLPGMILIIIGGFFILPRIFDFPFSFSGMLWPVMLVFIGVLILVKRIPHKHHGPRNASEPISEGFVHEDCVFSGSKQKIVHQTFRGGTINCIFGGVDLDLTQAELAEGTSELEINVIFGGVNLVVPSDWKILLKTSAVLGGFTDKRTILKGPVDSSRMLIIRGSTVFGGGEIKSY